MTLRCSFLLLLTLVATSSVAQQAQSATYADTRRLLLAMDRSSSSSSFKTLFEEADRRQSDLIHALYDPDQKVSLNAQSIIRYLADPSALAALDKWFEYRRTNTNEYWTSPVDLVPGNRILNGGGHDVAKLVLRNLHPNDKDFWSKVVAYNKRTNTALVEMVSGHTFTEGWHATVRRENGRWRLLTHYLVWQS